MIIQNNQVKNELPKGCHLSIRKDVIFRKDDILVIPSDVIVVILKTGTF
jgi:hypothetical protein